MWERSKEIKRESGGGGIENDRWEKKEGDEKRKEKRDMKEKGRKEGGKSQGPPGLSLCLAACRSLGGRGGAL